jgi:hypothetical protein
VFNKKQIQAGISISLIALMAASSAMAADSAANIGVTSGGESSAAPTVPVGGTSTATSKPLSMDDFYVSLFSNFHGPSIQSLGSKSSLDAKGKPSSRGINFDSNVTLAYLVTKSFGVGFEIPFFYLPGQKTAFEIGDIGLKIFEKKLIKTQNFSLYGNILIQAITSDYSRSLGQQVGLKTTPYFRYNIPSSRFSFGAWTEAKSYVGAAKGKAFKLWAAPHVDYQITPKLSAIFQYEIESDHMVGSPGALNFTTYQADFTPGIAYFITPSLMINPYVQIFTTDKIALDRTGVGAIITASL